MSSEAAAAAAWPRGGSESAADRGREVARARRRGLVQAAISLAVAALIAWRWRPLAGWIVGGVGVGFALLAWLSPRRGHRAVERWLRRFAQGVGAVLAWILLAGVTVGVFWPLGAILRARRRLRITTGFDAARASYWAPAPPPRGLGQYRRQF
jgi:hypothetical protein